MQINNSKKKINKKNLGYVFWITGLSGAGKTSIANLIKKDVSKKFGPTILINGDDIRRIFSFESYSSKDREKLAKCYSKFCKEISGQNMNIIFTVVGLFKKIHTYNRKNITNYIEIFIKSDVKKIINLKKKYIYKYKKNIVGLDIKPEYPEKPDIVVNNNFKKSLKKIAKELLTKIEIYQKKINN